MTALNNLHYRPQDEPDRVKHDRVERRHLLPADGGASDSVGRLRHLPVPRDNLFHSDLPPELARRAGRAPGAGARPVAWVRGVVKPSRR
jgi:hypothetical protein